MNSPQRLVFSLAVSCLMIACAPVQKPAAPAPRALSEAEMQAAFQKAATPTAEHALLSRFAGQWRTVTKMWMSPDSKPEETKGFASATMLLDGKFLKEEFSGKFMGKPFRGIGFTGYDTLAGEITSTWMDSMSTTLMVQTGSSDLAQNSITLHGTMSCPMSKDKVAVRSVTKLVDDKHRVFEMYNVGPDGKEFKGLEITYTRVAAKKIAAQG